MVEAMFDYVVEHSRALRIIAWEEAGGWTTLAKLYAQLDHRDVQLFMAILDRARRQAYSDRRYPRISS